MFIKKAMAQGIDPAAVGTIATDGARELFQMGVLGIMVVCLMAFIIYMHRSHKDERKEWREEAGKKDSQQQLLDQKRDEVFLRASDKAATSSDKLADAIAGLSRDIYRNNNAGGS